MLLSVRGKIQFSIRLVIFLSMGNWEARCLWPKPNRTNRLGCWLSTFVSQSSSEQYSSEKSLPVDIGIKEIVWNYICHEWSTKMTCLMLYIWSYDGAVCLAMEIIWTNMLKPCHKMNIIIVNLIITKIIRPLSIKKIVKLLLRIRWISSL